MSSKKREILSKCCHFRHLVLVASCGIRDAYSYSYLIVGCHQPRKNEIEFASYRGNTGFDAEALEKDRLVTLSGDNPRNLRNQTVEEMDYKQGTFARMKWVIASIFCDYQSVILLMRYLLIS
ncbi:hypothetical protein AVEN_59605-1 [Araneus ventricosus]|uniref:Uncharacterized protein n=1 Tax=Araneus ventricosus TaxID=182803 RepID=A0A4Y2J3X3_ARAVE|nr:hypothetical protein AVEN_59605-1 [Araneus ventricosus]